MIEATSVEMTCTTYLLKHPEKGSIGLLSQRQARKAFGNQILRSIKIVERKFSGFRRYGLASRPFAGTPIALVAFQKDPSYSVHIPEWNSFGPSLTIFQVQANLLAAEELTHLAAQLVQDVLIRCDERKSLPATAKIKRAGVLFAFENELRTYELQGL